MSTDLDLRVRMATFDWLERQVQLHGDVLTWAVIKQGVPFEGRRIALISQQGIFKPAILPKMPLSITTSFSGPYDDRAASAGDLMLYRYRGTDPMHRDNVGLREAMRRRTPLVYFYGIDKGRYLPAWPVFVVGDDPGALTFTVAVDDATITRERWSDAKAGLGTHADAGDTDRLWDNPDLAWAEPEDDARRAYITVTFRQRLHQRSFRERVLRAYRQQCALCRLRHEELLDAAHIIPDSDPLGEPRVSNGLSLCKLHHAAFDRHFIGIRPDYVVEVRRDVLEEEDGPMLLHGLKGMHDTRIELPRKSIEKPDPALLERRYDEFRSLA